MNEYMVTKSQQIAVKADNPDQALEKILKGEGTPASASYNIMIRPPQPQRPQPPQTQNA